MNNKELATKILSEIGNKENISQLTHCVTRLRFFLKDMEKIDREKIKNINGVLGVADSNGQFQVVLGNRVTDVFQILDQLIEQDGVDGEEVTDQPKSVTIKSIIPTVLDSISRIFTPIIPAIIGAGLMKGIIILLMSYNLVDSSTSTFAILDSIASSAFFFLPILLGFSAARNFGCNPFLGATLGGILVQPSLIELFNAHADVGFVDLFGIPVKTAGYGASVLPIIFGVWFMSYVEKGLAKVIPQSLRTVFQPVLTLLITAPVMLAVLAPIGSVVGTSLAQGFMHLYFQAGVFAGILFGASYPFIVLTGMHTGFFPVMMESIRATGFDYIMAIAIASNSAQAGAVLAAYLRAKNPQLKGTAGGAAFNALIGITEPALFGVTIKLPRVLFAVCIAGALGAGYMAMYQVGATGVGTGPLAGIPFFFGDKFHNYVIGCVISFLAALSITYSIGIQEEKYTK